MANHHRKFDREEAIALRNQGWNLTQIANKYSVSLASVSEAFIKMGISSMPSKERGDPDDLTLAYFAGLFDGEGHVSIIHGRRKNGNSNYWLQTGITSTSRHMIDYMKSTFQCGHVSHTGIKAEKKLDCWAWRCTSNDALHVLKLIEPYVIGKKEVIRLGIEFQIHDKKIISWEWCAEMKRRVEEINRET